MNKEMCFIVDLKTSNTFHNKVVIETLVENNCKFNKIGSRCTHLMIVVYKSCLLP